MTTKFETKSAITRPIYDILRDIY